jgi:subtilase family serine protease
MKTASLSLLAIGLMLCATGLFAQGQGGSHASVMVPDTTIERPDDVGIAAHTNHLILVRPDFTGTSPAGETPGSISPVYGLTYPCNTCGSRLIVIVDAYDYPTSLNDFNVFSAQFGLPQETSANATADSNTVFQVVYQDGAKPRKNGGWAQEAALDIEWAHAMAPAAKIVLVEAKSNSFANLFASVDAATAYIQSHGGSGEISMSWGGSEFSSEAGNDSHFQNNGIVYFASSGDTGGATIYPGTSPDVVSAGGTSVNRDKNKNFISETGWSGSGGGPSKYEPIPSYQVGVANASTTVRSAPDYSFDADPNTGVSVYDSTASQGVSGWLVFGGTSVSSPSLAGIVNRAGHFYSNSATELSTIYANRTNSADFRDILSGSAGSFTCSSGYDFVTGVGSNQGLNGK